MTAGSAPKTPPTPESEFVMVPSVQVAAATEAAEDSLPLLEALRDMMAGVRTPQDALASVLSSECTWSNPLFSAASRESIVETFDSFLSFALEPCFHTPVMQVIESDETLRFEWIMSYTHPLPWRPRVTFSGICEATLDAGGVVVAIEDDWHVSPWNVISQSLPTIPDIIWLWPAPHAETDTGLRRLVSKTRHYSIYRVAPHPQFRIRAPVQEIELSAIWATPALPCEAFDGGLRKMEQYSTVSPLAVRKQQGNLFEWSVSVPGTLIGSSSIEPPTPTAPNAEYVEAPPRQIAVKRFRGYSTATVFEEKLGELCDRLQENGLLPEGRNVECGRVSVRHYNAKVGFNSKGLLSIATYGSSTGVPRINEIAIVLSDSPGTLNI